jgi:hypothetical protein
MKPDRNRAASNPNPSKTSRTVVRPISAPTPMSQALAFLNRYANQILIGVIIVLAVVVLIRYRMGNSSAVASGAADSVTQARSQIERLKQIPQEFGQVSDDELASMRTATIDNANSELKFAQSASSTDPKLAADVQLAYGDLYWTLANLPELPGAATRPLLKMEEDPNDLLTKAQTAYQTVVSQYASQSFAVAAARLGLAAIAENQGKWDDAATLFGAILSDPQTPDAFKFAAQASQQQLPQLRHTVFIGTPATAPAPEANPENAFAPTTAPAMGITRGPAAGPIPAMGPMPTTGMSAPATQP